MAHLSSQAIGSILDHYADVIEGGNAYNSGTSFSGVPGRYPNDHGLRTAVDTPLSADSAGTTTSIVVASSYSWESARWVKTGQPGFFLLCTAGATAAQNEARRITGWNNTTKTFTVDAFSTAPGASGTFTVMQGFKRIPNGLDINDEDVGTEEGYDRFFDLSLTPESVENLYGNSTETWRGTLALRLRIMKHARIRDWRRSAAENIAILSSWLPGGTNADHTDGTYVRALFHPDAPEIEEDNKKIVATVQFPIMYRVQRGF